jgi:hypothetical protein
MDISFVVILGLPVLYATGSLKKIVRNTGVDGLCFVLYFVITAALSFVPEIKLTQGMRLSLDGAFFCISPAVYLIVKKRYTYKYYLTFVLTTLFSVALSFFSNLYTLPYLQYVVSFAIAVAAVMCFKAGAPVFTPVMMGVYGIAGGCMQLLSGMDNTIVLFGGLGMISLSTAVCLFVAYVVAKPRGRHARPAGGVKTAA